MSKIGLRDKEKLASTIRLFSGLKGLVDIKLRESKQRELLHQNPSGMVSERGPWLDEEHVAFVDL